MLKRISRDKHFYINVLALSAPMILQNIINNSLTMLDTFMIGTLGEEALSGVTLANTVFFIIALFVFGLQGGCSVLISQYWGKGDETTINRIVGIGFGLSALIGLITGIGISLFPKQIYSLSTNDPALISVAVEYARAVAFAQFFNGLSMLYIAAQRSMENPKLGLFILVMSMLLNTFLNWVLIFGKLGFPAMGVKGGAYATLISRIIEFIVTFSYAFRTRRFRLNLKAILHPGWIIFKDFLKYSLPVVTNEFLWGLGFSLYTVIIGHMPNAIESVAAYTITLNVERLLSAVYFGIGSAASILVGKALGANDKEGAHMIGTTMVSLTFVCGIVAALLMLVLSHAVVIPYIFPLFGAGELTKAIGSIMLTIVSISIPFRAFNFCNIVGVLRGGGDVKAGMLLDVGSMYLVSLPIAYITAFVIGAPIITVFLFIHAEEVVKFIFGLIRFCQKKWLRNVTREAV